MATTYPIALKKYIRLYAVFPPLLTFSFYGVEDFSLGFCVVVAAIMHALYYARVRKYFVVVVGNESLQLFSLLGQKEEIAYTDLTGPLERNFWIVRYYIFMSVKNPNKKLIVTNYIENIEQCLQEIAEHISRSAR